MANIKKYINYIVIILSIIFILLILQNKSNAAYRKEGINNFPESYQPYLRELSSKYPNWKFVALYTELDWNYVIDKENIFGKNLVPKSYSDRWKNTNKGEYNVEVDLGWVDCSRRAVQYTMDPRNFLNSIRIFQFEGLSYDSKTNNKQGIEKILYGTEFYNATVKYVTSSGSTVTMSSKYSDLILSAGKTSKVSTYHLASRIKQEVGPFLSHSSISGTVEGFKGLYNFYNIGATSSSEPMGAIKNGLRYARDGKGASQAIKDKYLIPWNTKERAITGGGIFIGSSYINLGQDTLYLQKFHVTNNDGNDLFWHQYMTNILAPYSESMSIYNAYSNMGMLDNSMTFIIPVYNNMPETRTENPNILETHFTDDNTKVYADVESVLNVRSGPSTSYEILTSVDSSVIMTRIKKGKQSGELWDKVKLANGIEGYVFHNYLKEVPNRQIERINLSIDNPVINKGESKKLQVEILPEEAKNNGISFSSSNTDVATVDSNGNILGIKSGNATITVKAKENSVLNTIKIEVYSPVTDLELNVEDLMLQVGKSFEINYIIFPEDANNKNVTYKVENQNILQVDENGKLTAINIGETIVTVQTEDGGIQKQIKVKVVEGIKEGEIILDTSLTLTGNQISGWNIESLEVTSIKEKIDTQYNIEIYNKDGKILLDNEKVGTGSVIKILDENNVIKMEYKIVIYGDVNGDGKINSIDLLVLQRHILEIQKIKDVFIIAGNINKNGKNPSSLDLLLIQRHILELKIIEQ